jgi:hypothetical protein
MLDDICTTANEAYEDKGMRLERMKANRELLSEAISEEFKLIQLAAPHIKKALQTKLDEHLEKLEQLTWAIKETEESYQKATDEMDTIEDVYQYFNPSTNKSEVLEQ